MLNERNTLLEDDGIEEEILVEEECSVAQAVWGDIQGNIENQTDLQNALDAKQDSLTEAQLNAVNSGITSEKVTTYDGYADQIASKADQSALNAESTARGEADTALGTRIDNEALARQQADNGLQSQIDAITSKSDVVDVVANYAALQAYDTSTLGNNDVVKVLDDETHEDALTYYRWSTTTQTWSYIGQEAPYYSKGQMDVKLAEKQDKLTAGANIQIQNGTISATDTKYTNGNGLNLNGTEFSANTDVLATKEDLEGYYTKPETDNLLAPKLEAEVVAELPTTGDQSKLYLTPKAHTTSTATGNPIEATITAQAGKIESFQLDGDTYQQTYTGKNLLRLNDGTTTLGGVPITTTNGTVNLNGTATSGAQGYYVTIGITASEPMVFSTNKSGATSGLDIKLQYKRDGTIYYPSVGSSFSLQAGDIIQQMYLMITNGSALDCSFSPMLEKGSTASSYEPYVGGHPSPNPSYPQDINVVTGTQTISINGTNYPISLGSLELCKLGTYKDYIYKDGGNWYKHTEIGKVVVDSSYYSTRYGTNSYGLTQFLINLSFVDYFDSDNLTNMLSNSFIKQLTSFSNTQTEGFLPALDPNLHRLRAWIRINTTTTDTEAQFKAWLDNNKPIFYYKLNTATDTAITDQTLIAQLEAIRTASLENGANTITNTATGSNLAGDMEIGYYGYNPRNRYDKWLWLDLNNNYEQIGGE